MRGRTAIRILLTEGNFLIWTDLSRASMPLFFPPEPQDSEAPRRAVAIELLRRHGPATSARSAVVIARW
jgi:hypothetical protein